MGRRPLVQVDQLVDLRAGERAAAPGELFEAVPLPAVLRHEHVEVDGSAHYPQGSGARRRDASAVSRPLTAHEGKAR